jgi:hypothetical protein
MSLLAMKDHGFRASASPRSSRLLLGIEYLRRISNPGLKTPRCAGCDTDVHAEILPRVLTC